MLNYTAPHDHAPAARGVLETAADFTKPSLIVPCLRRRDPAAVVAELCSALEREGRIRDLLPFYQTVLSHESLSSTAMSPGWALPHARFVGIPQLSFALGRPAEPLAWFGGGPVKLVWLFAVPESDGGTYLGLIASLAKLAQDRLRLGRLAAAPDRQAMFELLREIPLPSRSAAVLKP